MGDTFCDTDGNAPDTKPLFFSVVQRNFPASAAGSVWFQLA